MKNMWMPGVVSLETLALILIVVFAIKLLFLLIKPVKWLDVVAPIYNNQWVSMIVALILAYLVLGSLQAAGVTYVQILAVALFVSLLMLISVAVYAKDVLALGKKMVKSKNFWRKAWLPVLIWVVLVVMALNEMYAFF